MHRDESPGPVAVFAPIGRDAATAADLLQRAGVAALICEDHGALVAALECAAAVLVAEEGLIDGPAGQLADWVARQPPWSDLPFLMLTSRREHPRVDAWRQRQVDRLGNVSLVERPLHPMTLVSVVRAALRARRRQLEVRALLEARDAAAAQLEEQVQRRTAQLRGLNERLRDEMAERTRMEESLRHAQKMEALGQLTGGVAHDFNNLLMVISAGVDMLERQADPARRQRYLSAMRQSAERGAALTRQLLTFSRSHALRAETVDLPGLLANMSELLDRSLRGDVEVEVHLEPGLWPVRVDAGELELAILNLAVNARDAMDGSGRLTIAGANIVESAPGQDRELVRLSVCDTGSGMSDEVKARVFEPFFTTKDVGKGSGLGLAQVYGFAKQSGGRVEIDSVLGEGTTITLLLPRSREEARAREGRAVRPGAEAPAPDLHVLLVEDDAEVADLVADMLRGIGCQVLHVSGAKGALGALADGRRVDLVLSDIMMPGGTNGIELARELRRRRPELPVLLTSGYAESTGDDASALGLQVLRKPYGLEELREAVREQLARPATGS